MSEANGTSQPTEEFRIPDFVVNLIGRLQLENAALQAQLAMAQQQLLDWEKTQVQMTD